MTRDPRVPAVDLQAQIRDLQRETRKLRQHLRVLTRSVTAAILAIDNAMNGPSTVERGNKIARIQNALEIANDSAKHFGLGMSLKRRSKR